MSKRDKGPLHLTAVWHFSLFVCGSFDLLVSPVTCVTPQLSATARRPRKLFCCDHKRSQTQLHPIESNWPISLQASNLAAHFCSPCSPETFQNSHVGSRGAEPTPCTAEQTTSCAPPAYASCQISGASATRHAGKCHCSARRPERRCHPLYRFLFALS